MIHVSQLLFVGCAFGLLLYALQLVAVVLAPPRSGAAPAPASRHLHPEAAVRPRRRSRGQPRVLRARSTTRPTSSSSACAIAATPPIRWPLPFARRFPRRVRVVLQRGTPGLNPKVNQLATLARAARYEHRRRQRLQRARRAPTTSTRSPRTSRTRAWASSRTPSSASARRASARSWTTCTCARSVGAGMIGAKRVVGKDIVVGKSMALRKRAISPCSAASRPSPTCSPRTYVLGQHGLDARSASASSSAARRCATSRERRDARDFYRRYRRWSVIHRQCIGGPHLRRRRRCSTRPWSPPPACSPIRRCVDRSAASASSPRSSSPTTAPRSPCCAAGASRWSRSWSPRRPRTRSWPAPGPSGLWRREIDWRGNPLRVLPGTRLGSRAEILPTVHTPADGSNPKIAA